MKNIATKRKVLDGIKSECTVGEFEKSFFVIARCSCFHQIDSMYEVQSYITVWK